MKIENLFSYAGFLTNISKSIRKITLNIFNEPYITKLKNDRSPVTKYDLQIEDLIRTIILKEFPNHNIIGEEFENIDKGSGYTWIIDPIDGTKSFMTGRPLWGTMIALMYKYKPIISMIDFPRLNQLWIAYKDNLFLNGDKFNYEEKKELEFNDIVFASTSPELFEKKNLNKVNKLIKKVKFNLWSGDCHNYLSILEGKIDLIIEENLKCWDILPIIPMIKSQSLFVRDWYGKEIIFDGNIEKKFSVIATNQIKILKKAINYLN